MLRICASEAFFVGGATIRGAISSGGDPVYRNLLRENKFANAILSSRFEGELCVYTSIVRGWVGIREDYVWRFFKTGLRRGSSPVDR